MAQSLCPLCCVFTEVMRADKIRQRTSSFSANPHSPCARFWPELVWGHSCPRPTRVAGGTAYPSWQWGALLTITDHRAWRDMLVLPGT